MAKKKDVIKAAKELNDKLGLDPEIDTSMKSDELKQTVAEAGDLIEPGDNIGEETQALVDDLREDGWHNVAEDEEDEDEPTPEPEPEPDEEPEPKSKKGKGKGKPKSKTETPKEKSNSRPGMTRIEATVEAIHNGSTRTELPQAASDLYQESGGEDNPKVARLQAVQVFRTLIAWGAIDVDADGNIEVVK